MTGAERLNVRERPYHVWRRSDGYVSVTRGEPHNGRDTFDVLLVTEDWPTAFAAVEANRDERHDAVVRGWDA